MKILVQVTVQDAIGVTPITHFVTVESEYQHTAAQSAAKAAASLVVETVGEFVEWQEECLKPDDAAPVNPLTTVRPDHVDRLVAAGRVAGPADGYTPAEILEAFDRLDNTPAVVDDPEAWDALAFLTRTPEAIHDAVAEEGSD